MANKALTERLLVFAKPPIPGKVKTRLQPLLTEEQSALFQRRLLEYCLTDSVVHNNYQRELWVGDNHPCWDDYAKRFGVGIYFQQGAHLGQRMLNAFQSALKRSSKVVIIGTDCPFITPAYITEAFAILDEKDIVLGPAEDGGYVLVGMKVAQPSIFENISWGGSQVLSQTLLNIKDASLSCGQLSMLMDIDRPQDFLRLHSLLPQLTSGIID